MSEKVYEIKSLELITLKSNPPQYRVNVAFTTRAGGWHNFRLVKTNKPNDQFMNLELVGDAPTGGNVGSSVITSHKIDFYLGYIQEQYIGIRLIAQNGEKSVKFVDALITPMGGPDIFPWAEKPSASQSLELKDLVGRVVRVVQPGHRVTQEIVAGRVTIYLDEAHKATNFYVDPISDT